MLNLLQSIADFFANIGSFIVSLINGMISLMGYVNMALVTLGQVILYLPADLVALGMAFISVAVVFLIVGR